jgi:hypothetical protein
MDMIVGPTPLLEALETEYLGDFDAPKWLAGGVRGVPGLHPGPLVLGEPGYEDGRKEETGQVRRQGSR